MQDAIKQKQKRMLRLVKSTDAIKSAQKPMIDSEDYYRQVKRYAEQIRNTNNADDIIRILDIVLSETRGLRFSDEVFSAQEQVNCAEQKIESLKSELEQLRGLVQTDQVTGAFNRAVDWTIFLNAKRLVPIGYSGKDAWPSAIQDYWKAVARMLITKMRNMST